MNFGNNNGCFRTVISLSQVKIDVVLSYCRATPIDQSLVHYIPFFKVFCNFIIFLLFYNDFNISLIRILIM